MSEVRHNASQHRFEAGSEANPAHVDYRLSEGAVEFVHTEVPPEYQGQGLAGKLATEALAWARESKRRVSSSCSYMSSFIAKRPEYQDLL